MRAPTERWSTPVEATSRARSRVRFPVASSSTRRPPVPAADRSIVFHLAHSPVRELEILHDQLLALLAVTGLTHRQAYKDIFAVTLIKTMAVFVVIGLYYAFGLT